MMQGDSYGLIIGVRTAGGGGINVSDVKEIEFMLGRIRKLYSGGDITLSETEMVVHLSQEETFSLRSAPIKAQVRVSWVNGDIEGHSLGYINVSESISKEVL